MIRSKLTRREWWKWHLIVIAIAFLLALLTVAILADHVVASPVTFTVSGNYDSQNPQELFVEGAENINLEDYVIVKIEWQYSITLDGTTPPEDYGHTAFISHDMFFNDVADPKNYSGVPIGRKGLQWPPDQMSWFPYHYGEESLTWHPDDMPFNRSDTWYVEVDNILDYQCHAGTDLKDGGWQYVSMKVTENTCDCCYYHYSFAATITLYESVPAGMEVNITAPEDGASIDPEEWGHILVEWTTPERFSEAWLTVNGHQVWQHGTFFDPEHQEWFAIVDAEHWQSGHNVIKLGVRVGTDWYYDQITVIYGMPEYAELDEGEGWLSAFFDEPENEWVVYGAVKSGSADVRVNVYETEVHPHNWRYSHIIEEQDEDDFEIRLYQEQVQRWLVLQIKDGPWTNPWRELDRVVIGEGYYYPGIPIPEEPEDDTLLGRLRFWFDQLLAFVRFPFVLLTDLVQTIVEGIGTSGQALAALSRILFGWLPSELMGLLVAGFSLVIILRIVGR